jgi:hypothetical protein
MMAQDESYCHSQTKTLLEEYEAGRKAGMSDGAGFEAYCIHLATCDIPSLRRTNRLERRTLSLLGTVTPLILRSCRMVQETYCLSK